MRALMESSNAARDMMIWDGVLSCRLTKVLGFF